MGGLALATEQSFFLRGIMVDYEKLGAFYLGREYDLENRKCGTRTLLYESKDLTTHAVCVGMTGSGKTGLCLTLLEEAAIDQIPAIVIDPKGDLGNLLLTFPDLKPADFEPWIDPAEATRKGMTVEELARKSASDWKKGLADWDQDPERIERFRNSADITIYTPGSNAGLPLTVLRSFTAPEPEILANADALRERIGGAVSGLLALLGVGGDALRSREHILLATILERAWKAGRHLDMATLIREIQSPPFSTIGVMDIESIFPAGERFNLSMSLNNLLASPGFSSWLEGEPLDIQKLLYTETGKPRISILSIAHLSDSERMFFVTILLNEVIAWMRAQAGTSSLRALLYMDEVYGYFPPSANPPAKTPMLTLLKQARAYGLGVILATQNPVDLDYKGLANAGTWFIGRMQTERDKLRVLDGLEGASAAAGSAFDRSRMEKIISALGNRVFLLNNVHDDGPVVFQSRQVLSYLRGPMTREQIQRLTASRKAEGASTVNDSGSGSPVAEHRLGPAGQRPVLPPEIPEFFHPEGGLNREGRLIYQPALMGSARVHFTHARSGVDVWETLTLLKPVDERNATSWENAEQFVDEEPNLEKKPAAGDCGYEPLPGELMRAKSFGSLSGDLRDFLYRTHVLLVWKSTEFKEFSKPGETERDFRSRLGHTVRERRDLKIERLRAKYAPKLKTLEDRERRARQRLEREQTQASNQRMSSMLSVGSSILGAMFGRKLGTSSNVSKAATAARNFSKISGQQQEVAQAQETLEAVALDRAELDARLRAEEAAIEAEDPVESIRLESFEVKPKKTDITVTRVALVWIPFRQGADGSLRPSV